LGCNLLEIKVNLSGICFPSVDFVSSEVEGNLVIVPLVNGIADLDRRIYTLSETGFAIWQKLDGKKTLGQITAELAEQFNCPLKDIQRDVLVMIAELLRRGICQKLSDEQVKPKNFNNYYYKEGENSEAVSCSGAVLDDIEQAKYITYGSELSLSNPGQLALLERMAERGVPLRTSVRGFSMHPFICDRDILIITPVDEYELILGDIVAFTNPDSGRLVIHRIIEKTATGWLLKGDNCLEADGVIDEKKIIGRVTCIERGEKEIRFGLGIEKKLIAFLNRCNGLAYLKKLWHMPRRIAGYSLRTLQNLSTYRLLWRRFAPPFSITLATDSDLEEVNRRFNPFVPYRRQPPSLNVTNLVAKTGGKLAGFVHLVYHPEDHHPWMGYWLFSLYVWGRYRALGLGEKLTGQVIEEAKNMGASFLSLVVYEDNFEAINLYQKLGFSQITNISIESLLAEEKEQTGRRRIVMQKSLRCGDD
jgi:ribosomal protein S18 acetylase RimI-like enzyme